MRVLLVIFLALPVILKAQLTTGILEGTVHNVDGRSASELTLFIAGRAGFQTVVRTDSEGHFTLSLPYGRYTVCSNSQPLKGSVLALLVEPLRTAYLNLVIDRHGFFYRLPHETLSLLNRTPGFGLWSKHMGQATFSPGFSLQSIVSSEVPGSVAVPLDFTGLGDNRLALISGRAFSWTSTQFLVQGLDATDSYQPGRPVILPDIQAAAEVVVRTDLALATSGSYGDEVDTFLEQPGTAWHAAISTFGTGSALSSSNLPQPRGMVQQPERFDWFTRNRFEVGGPVTRWADLFASVAGQWASQMVELAAPGQDQSSRTFFDNIGGDIRAGPHDRLDVEYSGSRLQLSGWGLPAGIEALTSRRMSPEFDLANGFPDEAEGDRFRFLQVGWTHQRAAGTLQVRYGYSAATLHTWPGTQTVPNQSRIELLDSTITGAPPLESLATRPRDEVAIAWQPAAVNTGGFRHQITIGGTWELSSPGNQMTAPSDLNLIAAAGTAAAVVEYNTPVNALERIRTISAYAADHLVFRNRLSLNFGALADAWRGSLPAQNSPAGLFTSVRHDPASGTLIAWNSASPRAGFTWRVPCVPRLVIHGGYLRLYSPLAGRYLDYANPNSLGGSVYQWIDRNGDGWFQPAERGALLLRFGGPYSFISPSLHRPYADEFDAGAQFLAARNTVASVQLFRRDEKHRIAAIDSGLGASPSAFTPVRVLDPGPDGIPGTFDDQHLTVYQQDPASLGKDAYVLTNAPGLRDLNIGIVAEIGTKWRGLVLDAAFTAEKAWGPTNPGNAVFENDPGVIGTLFIDPNSTNGVLARSYVDRAYLGKLQATYQLPSAWGRLELTSIANYLDGLPFARELLISGLAQGPFLVPTTVRGSPQGGNRAQYLFNWNLGVEREFRLRPGRLALFAEILNVTNSDQEIHQSDLTGPAFNSRLPVAIQPARSLRLGVTYSF